MNDALVTAVRAHPRLVVLTGAGLSAASGIPTYRDDTGKWRSGDPIQHQEFIQRDERRRRYWARSMSGWRHVHRARPNAAHEALDRLERQGHVRLLVTQNVDRLHQRAGSRRVVDLHGRLDRVQCRGCGAMLRRGALQHELVAANPGFTSVTGARRPDGDADVDDRLVDAFRIPDCRDCGGMLMPDVVFFGGTVPRERVERVRRAVDEADALLVAGSSLVVWSGFRFCRQAVEAGKPLYLVNRGATRADGIATLKVRGDCAPVLQGLARSLAPGARSLDSRTDTGVLRP